MRKKKMSGVSRNNEQSVRVLNKDCGARNMRIFSERDRTERENLGVCQTLSNSNKVRKPCY
jgi:hypothetical protein